MAKTPEESRYTSIFRRLHNPSHGLIPFEPSTMANTGLEERCLPITFNDYLSLVDWTGRQLRPDKRGRIPEDAPPIFERLNYSPEQWFNTLQPTITWRQKAIGSAQRIAEYCQAFGQRWIWQAAEHEVGS